MNTMECLIPDILFTLLGYKSDILQYIVDSDGNFTEVDILNVEDRCLLKCFLDLAEEYKKLNNIIVSHGRVESIYRDPALTKHGIYYDGLVDGMIIALQPYKKCVHNIERDLLNNKENRCLLAEILRKVEYHKPLIVEINSILEHIELSHLCGGQILNLIYDRVNMNFTDNKIQLTLIFKQCLEVFLLQLNTFFAHGVIFDPHKEFFIEAVFSKTTNEFKHFTLVPSLMPSFVPLSTASKITRIGDVIKSLQHSQDQLSSINYKDISTKLYGSKKDQLFSDLLNLKNIPLFTKNEFVGVIDKFYNIVDEYMLNASYNDNSFKYHMKLIRDFYLLGNGEFYIYFLKKLHSLSMKHEQSLRAIKTAFINTAQETKLNKCIYKAFKFNSSKNEESDDIIWTKLKVSIETTWPLQFIFTKLVQENYSKLFTFLSRIKKVQTNLHEIWIENKFHKMNSSINQLRTNLTFFIDTLYNYLQLDVIEDEYFLFLEKLSVANNFQTIKHIHDVFQTHIMRDSFLFMEDVYLTFNKILDMCENYYRYFTEIGGTSDLYYKQSYNELNSLFTQKSNILVKLLNTIKEIHVTPKPNQFLTKLNYNGWYFRVMLGKNNH